MSFAGCCCVGVFVWGAWGRLRTSTLDLLGGGEGRVCYRFYVLVALKSFRVLRPAGRAEAQAFLVVG